LKTKKFICDLCDFGSNRKSNLKVYILKHLT
jgi:hypothetical protein